MSTAQASDVRGRVAEVPVWWHSITLPGGVVTPGQKSPAVLDREWANLALGDLRGKSVLDIGAWDGYFSFAAERAGAERVVALDHYTWSMDLKGYGEYRADRLRRKLPIAPPEDFAEYWHPDTLPGKRGFDVARQALGSRVESVVGDLMTFDLDQLGLFDVVLYLGVLYHVRHPLLALERLAKVTRGQALVETQAETYRGRDRRALCRFFEGAELNGDPSNWWVFNDAALVSMCRAAGFASADVLHGPSALRRAYANVMGAAPYRSTVRAHR